MRDNDGRKLDHKTLETLRIRAVQQIEHGARVEDVAATLGLARSTVFGWVAKYREGGCNALAARPVPGRPPKLSGAQLARIYDLIVGRDPRQLSFEFALWTRQMVRELIRREFGVGAVGGQRGPAAGQAGAVAAAAAVASAPAEPGGGAALDARAVPGDPRAGRPGRGDDLVRRRGRGALDYHAGTTWAPVGRTPIVRTTGARHSVNLISAVTGQGVLRFAAYEGTFTAATFLDFCKRLLHDTAGPVFLVVDGHPTHRSRAVTEFVASTNGRLRLFLLPGYSPELNPEWVWKNVKADRVGRAGVTGSEDLKAQALSALHRLQKLPHLIRGFFADSNLRYITA